MEILKVSAKSNPNSVAGALAGVLREHSSAEMQAMNRLLERQTAAAEGETAAISQLQRTLTAMEKAMADGEAREEG